MPRSKLPKHMKPQIPYRRQMGLDRQTLRRTRSEVFVVKPQHAALAGARLVVMTIFYPPVWAYQKLTGREVIV